MINYKEDEEEQDEEDPSNMTFAQRITSQLQKLRKRGAPPPGQPQEENQGSPRVASTWIGNPAKPPKIS